MPDLVPSRSVVKRPSRWGRWFRAIEFAVQLTLAVVYIVYAVRYYQITTRLNEAEAEMDRTDPGWRLQDIEAARAVVPDAENSALRVMAVNKLLPKPSDRWIKDDFAAELQRLRPEKRMTPEQFAHLRQCLAGVRPALEEARTLSDLSHGRFPLVYAPTRGIRCLVSSRMPGQSTICWISMQWRTRKSAKRIRRSCPAAPG